MAAAEQPDMRFVDPEYLLHEQYSDAARLNARIALHERYGTSPTAWHRWLFERIAPATGERLLEVGCGSGALWLRNRERIPNQCVITLTDLSLGMVGDARSALGDVDALWFALVDAQALPFPPASFDVVIANHMLYHVADVPRALREMRRSLRPGGRLIAATNGRAHMHELLDALRTHIGYEERHDSVDQFGLETGEALLRQSFDRVEILRFEDELVVTDAEAVVAYGLSVAAEGTDAGRLREHVERVIRSDGAFRITKETGVFVAR